MSEGRKRRSRTLVALAAGLCIPLVALISPAPASAATVSVMISVVSSANPSTLGQDVTYTVTLTTDDEGALDPADGIEFQDNGNTISNCNNQLLSGMAPPGIYTATCDEPGNSLSVATTPLRPSSAVTTPTSGRLPSSCPTRRSSRR